MTKKDYIEIAKVMNKRKPYPDCRGPLCWDTCWDSILEGLCFLFKKDNPLFNREKFEKACKGGE